MYRRWKTPSRLMGLGDSIAKLWRRITWPWRILVVLLAVVAAQQLWPVGQLSLLARLDGQRVGNTSFEQLRKTVEQRAQQGSLHLGSQTKQFALKDAGITADTAATLRPYHGLSKVERFIPLWPEIKLLVPVSSQSRLRHDEQALQSAAAKLASESKKQPKGATAAIENGDFVVNAAEPGESFTDTVVATALKRYRLYGAIPSAPAVTSPAPVTKTSFDDLQKQYERAVGQDLMVTIDGQKDVVPKSELRGWFVTQRNPSDETWKLAIDAGRVDSRYTTWNKRFAVAPGKSELLIVDGSEVSRKEGKAGRVLDKSTVISALSTHLLEARSGTLTLATVAAAPTESIQRNYSETSKGLQALVDDWTRTHKGTYGVYVHELTGKERVASYRGSTNMITASTYKLFIAYLSYYFAEQGQFDLNAKVLGSKTAEQCIEVMIVNSDNDCATALGNKIGWIKIDQTLASQGYNNVQLNNYSSLGAKSSDKHASPVEIGKLLERLNGGTLLNQSHSDRMLGYMKRQVYRLGVPAGSHGAAVADKVGFLYALLHDAAIVYSPNGRYILVIMTDNSSWSNIADLSNKIYTYLGS